MTEIKLGHAWIVTAFDDQTIGTKVTDTERFTALLPPAIANCDFENQKKPGQALIMLPPEAANYVSAGSATRSDDDEPQHFVIRKYREGCKMFLRREVAEAQGRNIPTGCAVVVYTLDAYLNDPDIDQDEADQLRQKNYTHILVAVLGFSEDEPVHGPFRFAANLAGGNLEALEWTADEIRNKAKLVVAYANKYTTVAD